MDALPSLILGIAVAMLSFVCVAAATLIAVKLLDLMERTVLPKDRQHESVKHEMRWLRAAALNITRVHVVVIILLTALHGGVIVTDWLKDQFGSAKAEFRFEPFDSPTDTPSTCAAPRMALQPDRCTAEAPGW